MTPEQLFANLKGMITSDTPLRVPAGDKSVCQPAFLVIDTESVPDGRLLSLIKYRDEDLTPDAAVRKAQAEARALSKSGSDFLPASYQFPVAVCVLRVGSDFKLQRITPLDAPEFRPRTIVTQFWEGLARIRSKLVTYNGRGFDLPLLELAAFRYGASGRDYFQSSRNRFNGHVDLMDWLNNYGACHHQGGLNLLAKILGKPGKMEVAGDQVYDMFQAGQMQEINDYCICDTLDTYFIFLRTRVMTGDLSLDQEHEVVQHAKEFLVEKRDELPILTKYLDKWGDWDPWP